MTRVLQVADTRSRVVLHMTEILDALEPEASALNWAILDLREAFAPDGSDLDVLAVERQVAKSPGRLHMSFAELVAFAGGLQQVIDGLFVGASDAAELPSRADPDQTILEQADMVLAAFDSSFWLISAPDSILARVAAHFSDVTALDASEATLSAWGADAPRRCF